MAFDVHAAADMFDNAFNHGQSDTVAVGFRSKTRVENTGQEIFGDTLSGIFDANDHLADFRPVDDAER
jgi:hypothetical protein